LVRYNQTMSKFIILNGSVGVGKSTLTQRYLDEHAFVLGLDGDALMGMIGQWLTHEDEARSTVFTFTLQLAGSHLKNGHDVILPYLLTDVDQAQTSESLAKEHNAQFYEILLHTPKEEALQRALRRGKWGEPGSPPLTADDRPILEDLYIKMMQVVAKRPHTIQIHSVDGAIDETYEQFLAAIS
jgi:predicted kinase